MFEHIISNKVLLAEASIIFTVFIIQIYFFIITFKKANVLSGIFKPPMKVEKVRYSGKNQDAIDLSSKNDNEVSIRIKDSINNYLHQNIDYNVNYSIIKDIIDREVDSKDTEVNLLIPIPLYLGLAATIIGIIFGLIAMPELNTGEGDPDLSGIVILINGVKIAMFASLTGLFWTIILSSFVYSSASRAVLKDKNLQLSYLQEKLLPELIKTEDSGIIGLKSSIDKFVQTSGTVVDNIQATVKKTSENIIKQQDTLNKIEKLNVTKISKVNIELFEKLDSNMEAYKEFSKYIDRLSIISKDLANFSSTTKDVETIANDIRNTLHTSQKLYQYLTGHIEKIEKMGDHAITTVDIAERNFSTAIEALKNDTAININSLSDLSDQYESKIAEIYQGLIDTMNRLADNHINAFTAAYENSIPKFDQLEYLKELEDIKAELQHLNNGNSSSLPHIVQKMDNLDRITVSLASVVKSSKIISENTQKLEFITKVKDKSYIFTLWERFISFIKKIFGRS